MGLFKISVEDLNSRFRSLSSERDVASLLEIKFSSLVYYARVLTDDLKYTGFSIPKKSGGNRDIAAPIQPLRFIQKKLNFVLQRNYPAHYCSHGFVMGKSIVSNASVHVKQKCVLNIDLKDFFPSINFGRVRGAFMAPPFRFNPTVATFLSQIVCYKNQLPQGAPTSPVVSNLICARMDNQLRNFARIYGCRFSRYADDLTISTHLRNFPEEVARIGDDGRIILSEELTRLVVENGFIVNDRKVRLRNARQRLVVTGITVNKRVNVERRAIRQIRAMLHAWQKFGVVNAEREYYDRYESSLRNPLCPRPGFVDIVRGKVNYIGMVRGKDDCLYRKFCSQLKELDSRIRMRIKLRPDERIPLVVTEGSSDWKHLKAAFRYFKRLGLFSRLSVRFSEYKGGLGESLLETATNLKKIEPNLHKIIFIFDSDIDKKVKSMNDASGRPKYWGNQVYSFTLPVPAHRASLPGVSIELYYTDNEIVTMNQFGQRFFLKSEFQIPSGSHLREPVLCNAKGLSRIRKGDLYVLDRDHLENGSSISFSKEYFASSILKEEVGFTNFNFDSFKPIFENIESITNEANVA